MERPVLDGRSWKKKIVKNDLSNTYNVSNLNSIFSKLSKVLVWANSKKAIIWILAISKLSKLSKKNIFEKACLDLSHCKHRYEEHQKILDRMSC